MDGTPMSHQAFRAFLDLLMVSDPWPNGVEQKPLTDWADKEARSWGYRDWIEAYHVHGRPGCLALHKP